MERQDKNTLDYATPSALVRQRRRVTFGGEMMKASSIGCLLTIWGTWSIEGPLMLLTGSLTWIGVTIAWYLRSVSIWVNADESVPMGQRAWTDRVWRPVVVVLALLTLSMTIRTGRCPHREYWGIGFYVHVTVTDPSGRPCNNPLQFKPLLFYRGSD